MVAQIEDKVWYGNSSEVYTVIDVNVESSKVKLKAENGNTFWTEDDNISPYQEPKPQINYQLQSTNWNKDDSNYTLVKFPRDTPIKALSTFIMYLQNEMPNKTFIIMPEDIKTADYNTKQSLLEAIEETLNIKITYVEEENHEGSQTL